MTLDDLKKLLDEYVNHLSNQYSDQVYEDLNSNWYITKDAFLAGAKFNLELLWPLVEALNFYGNHNFWIAEGIKSLGLQSKRRSIIESDVNFCGGKRARQTLADLEQKLKGG